jgi:RNA 2',3'-cyclic 3'-phosphodiesterase
VTPPGSVGRNERLRLFLALRLPASVLDALDTWSGNHLAGSGRRVARDHLHITLAFLGSRPAGELADVVAALRAAASRASKLQLAARRWRETRNVGMVVLEDAGGAAASVAADLHDRLEALGVYRREARPWLPHVTVLRFRERPRLAPPLPELGSFAPSDAAAYLSRLHPSGARYEVLESTPLGG